MGTHQNVKMKSSGKIYSCNEANYAKWDDAMKEYVDGRKKGGFKSRYIGSMVADVHRTLLYGGVFMYPADAKNKNGKLRLVYEAAPMAFLVEQAGVAATTGRG